ncbi:MAG: phosphatidate cytidylyltransferase [Rhodospirillales bacterium]|nr:phosphatidate cytidylyltransferase [Rhodospirillales bacterium]
MPASPTFPPAANSLGLRVLSALVLAPPVLWALWYGRPAFDVLVGMAVLILAWEWDRLTNNGQFGFAGIVVGLTGLGALAVVDRPILVLAVAALGALAAALARRRQGPHWAAFGALYVALPTAAILWLRHRPDTGREDVLWLFAVVWATDIGAYAAGRLIGGPKLAPAISPKKTWAGLAGGMLAAALVGMGVDRLLSAEAALAPIAIGAAILAVISQMGDLFESFVKRHFGVKDASRIIPGHGGLLDRVDGLVAAGLAMAGYTLYESVGGAKAW